MNKTAILFFVTMMPRLALAYDVATMEQVERFGLAISSGENHSCVLKKSGVKCWGDNRYGQLNVPPLSHPRQISAGDEHTCAIDDSGVKCWGDNQREQLNVPALSRPRQISAGGFHTCALGDSGIKCWGFDADEQASAPRGSYARQVAAGGYHTCALDNSEVKCWGDSNSGQLSPPSLSHPRSIYSGIFYSCAWDDSGIKCWGNGAEGPMTVVPNLSGPRQLAVGNYHICALEDSGVKCWGFNRYGQINVPALSEPHLVSVGGNHSCALDDTGVKCWGSNNWGQLNVPDLDDPLPVSFDLFSLEQSYTYVSDYVYQDKKLILENLAKTIEKFPINKADALAVSYVKGASRLFSMYVLEILLQETHSDFVQRRVLPLLAQSKSSWSKKFGVSNIQEIELSRGVLDVSFTVVDSGLRAAKTYLSGPQQKDLEDLLMAVAQAKALIDSSPPQAASQLASVLDQHQNLLTALVESERSVGFGKMILTIQSYLKGHESL